jgi:hypothetical protein
VGFANAVLALFSDMFWPFMETGKHAGYFELKDTDAGIDLVVLIYLGDFMTAIRCHLQV